MSDKNYKDSVKEEFDNMKKNDNLGKVDLTEGSLLNSLKDDKDMQKLNSTMGYNTIELNSLPSKGRYYSDNFQIKIRAARVTEIREFSAVDENNPIDVNEKLNYILYNCAIVYYGSTIGSPKDICNMDKLHIILLIRELTFSHANLELPLPQDICSTYGCEQEESISFRLNAAKFETKYSEILEKVYSPEDKFFKFVTKGGDVIIMRPPTVGVHAALFNYRANLERNGKKYDKALISLVNYFAEDWRGLDDKKIFEMATTFDGWGAEKYAAIFNWAMEIDKCSIPELITTCKKCGGEIRVPLNFQFGTREIFVPKISSSSDYELI